jgi:hypothetical protein
MQCPWNPSEKLPLSKGADTIFSILLLATQKYGLAILTFLID